MQTTNRQPMERYAAKTKENTEELYNPGITVLIGDKGVIAENGYFYKIVALGPANEIIVQGTPSDGWEVKGVATGQSPGEDIGIYDTNIRLFQNNELLGRFKKIETKSGTYIVAYAKTGTRVKVL